MRGPGGAEKEVVIRAAAHGHVSGERTIRIQPGAERADFELYPTVTLTGRVRLRDRSKEPLRLRVTTESGLSYDLTARLDERRRQWSSDGVPAGKVRAVLRCGGLAPFDFGWLELEPGAVRELPKVELMRGGTISGQANRDREDRAATGAVTRAAG